MRSLRTSSCKIHQLNVISSPDLLTSNPKVMRQKIITHTSTERRCKINIHILGKRMTTLSSLNNEFQVDAVSLPRLMLQPWSCKRTCIRFSDAFSPKIIRIKSTNIKLCHNTNSTIILRRRKARAATIIQWLIIAKAQTSCLQSETPQVIMYTKPLKTKILLIIWSQRLCFSSIQHQTSKVCSQPHIRLATPLWLPKETTSLPTTVKCNEPEMK